MSNPVSVHSGYYTIDTRARLSQRTGPLLAELSSQLSEFTRCDVFGDYHPQMDTAARMQLWCAARGYRTGDGSHTWHDDEILTERIDIVLAETQDRQAIVLAAIGTSPPQVFPDVTTDPSSWLQDADVDIACPAGHRRTWDGEEHLTVHDHPTAAGTTVSALFGEGRQAPFTACRDCAAYHQDDSSSPCPHQCEGTTIYCPVCHARCALQLPEIPTHPQEPTA